MPTYSWDTPNSSGGSSGYSWDRKPSSSKPTTAQLQTEAQHLLGGGGSSFLHSVEGVGQNFLAGLYETGRSSVIDVKNEPASLATGPAAPITANILSLLEGHGQGQLTKNVAIPTALGYKNKYYGRNGFQPGQVGHNIAADPFGTLLDVAALGTIPIGGEGLAIRGAALADTIGLAGRVDEAGNVIRQPTALGRTLARAAVRAREAQTPRDIHYAPPGSEGETFQAPRARTLQGRYIYNPVREALGRAAGGTLPIFGDAARLAKFQAKQMDFELAKTAQAAHDYHDAISANLRPSKRLTKAERLAMPLMLEYGPDTAKAAELGAPRLQRVAYYQDQLASTMKRLDDLRGTPNRAKLRGTLRAVARSQKRMLNLLNGDTKFASEIDQVIKDPRPVVTDTILKADELSKAQGQTLIQHGMATHEILDERRFLPQYLLHGHTWHEAEAAPEAVAGEVAGPLPSDEVANESVRQERAAAEVKRMIESGDVVPSGHPDAAIPAEMRPSGRLRDTLEQVYTDSKGDQYVVRDGEFRLYRTREQVDAQRDAASGGRPTLLGGKGTAAERGVVRAREAAPAIEAGFRGGSKSLAEIRAEHPDARYYPHLGPPVNAEGARIRRSLSLAKPSVAKHSEGRRFVAGQVALGADAPARAYMQTQALRATDIAREQLRPLAIPVEGDKPLEGYSLVNLNDTHLGRSQRESAALDEHFQNLTTKQHAARMQEEISRLFPSHANSEDEAAHLMQVPDEFAKRLKRDYKQSHLVTRKLVDFPLTVWKALVLKYRPAWLVNNILGQHLLLLLHHPLGWNDYVQNLSPRKRRELARGIHGLANTGTSELIRHNAMKDLGFEDTLRGRVKSGEVGGIVGKVAYRAVDYPWKVVKGFGDGMARANMVVADNQTRLTLGRRYVKEYRDTLRSLEIANGAVESAVKGKSLEQVAAEMPTEAKIELLRKVNSALGDFNTMRGPVGKNIRRVLPFAAWFKVILEISRDLAVDHPEKVWLVYQMEQAAKKDPHVVPQFDVPSWFLGSVIAPWFKTKPGDTPLLSTTSANPFETPIQLAQQLGVLLHNGPPSGDQSPVASLGPGVEAFNLLQGYDPFYGGVYQGPGDKSIGIERVALGIGAGLPPVRLANAGGLPLTGKYHAPASYNDAYANVGGHDIPIDALLRYLGLPLRRANRAKLQGYAKRGL